MDFESAHKQINKKNKAYFRLFRHVTLYLMRWASNATAAFDIFPKAHKKKWRYFV